MHSVTCRGLPAAWLNGWLAAVGATVLDDRLRLHWTEDGAPVAVLSADDVDPVEAVVASWPDEGMLADLPIAEDWKGPVGCDARSRWTTSTSGRGPHGGDPHSWALSSTMTDLSVDENDEVAHAPLDPAGPGTIKWLHHRLMKVHAKIAPSVVRIGDSLAGRAVRVNDNGLGFDQTRLGSLSDSTDRWVDPVVETLAFFGLALLPVRGRGSDRQSGHALATPAVQKGWSRADDEREYRFRWPGWSPSLDSAGVDALLDVWRHDKQKTWLQYGIHAAWRSVPFKPTGSADTTRAYGSERL